MYYFRSLRFVIFLITYFTAAIATESIKCLTDNEAHSIVADFAIIASEAPGYVKVAKQRLTPDFTSITDSVNFVDGIPVRIHSKTIEHNV